ncbi:hypothetical protein GCM10008939_06630 [Deinococcus aquiradiocola]|uniref:Uncharacterized protein n=1 Tax=Deinococcus aquiradiocola TaxID=393059 RepID=A0A917P7H7_9DEIO|nr:hypothetical protein GCM10008939_06630 [Deinococcus aquiradiocola]
MLLAALLASGWGGAVSTCVYSGGQSLCFDLSNPVDLRLYREYVQRRVEAATPKAGIFDGPMATPQTVTAPDLPYPDPSNLTAFRVDRALDGVTLLGNMSFVPTRVRLAGIEILPGAEAEAAKVMKAFASPGTGVSLELTGRYENGVRTAYVWQLGTLMNLLLVERGLAKPSESGTQYVGELDVAAAFSSQAGTGMNKPK